MISLHSPVETWAHALPAGLKLAALCALTLTLFFVRDPWLMGFAALAVLGLYGTAGKRFAIAGWRALRLLWPFVMVIALWHLLTQAYANGALIVLRMIAVVALANFVTMTTQLSELVEVVRLFTRPLARVGLRPQVLDLAIALVMRMVPVLVASGARLTESWRARSARRAGWPIVLPMAVLALDDADHVAEALRARGGLQDWTED